MHQWVKICMKILPSEQQELCPKISNLALACWLGCIVCIVCVIAIICSTMKKLKYLDTKTAVQHLKFLNKLQQFPVLVMAIFFVKKDDQMDLPGHDVHCVRLRVVEVHAAASGWWGTPVVWSPCVVCCDKHVSHNTNNIPYFPHASMPHSLQWQWISN